MKLRAVIADDETYGRRAMAELLRDHADVEVAAECSNGDEVLATLAARAADVVFLDVQMPGRDGLATARELLRREPDRRPLVVFVTAFDKHAVDAFEQHAIDYLLKPVAPERLAATLLRVREHLRSRADSATALPVESMLQTLEKLRAADRRIRIEAAGRTLLLRARELSWAESQGNYVRIHGGDEPILLRMTLTELEQTLAGHDVLRVHRTSLVHTGHVREVRSTDGGNTTQLRLDDGTLVPVGRSFRDAVLAALRDLS